MKKYILKDLKPVSKPTDLIKKQPEKYLSNIDSPGNEIASGMLNDALTLGANEVQIKRLNEWIMISADIAWFRSNLDGSQDISHVFDRLIAIPEKCVNSFRTEILVFTFSEACFVNENGKITSLKGGYPNVDILNAINSKLPFTIGFKC